MIFEDKCRTSKMTLDLITIGLLFYAFLGLFGGQDNRAFDNEGHLCKCRNPVSVVQVEIHLEVKSLIKTSIILLG